MVPLTKQYRRNTRDLLRMADMMAVKASIVQMCERLAISDVTLFRYYGRELEAAGYPILGQRRDPTKEVRDRVAFLASLDLSQEQICAGMDNEYTPQTLVRYFRDDIERGKAALNIKLRRALLKAGTEWMDKGEKMPFTAVSPLIFACKALLGMKETGRTELTGPDGQPIQTLVQHVIVLPSNGRDEPMALTDESGDGQTIDADPEDITEE